MTAGAQGRLCSYNTQRGLGLQQRWINSVTTGSTQTNSSLACPLPQGSSQAAEWAGSIYKAAALFPKAVEL